MISGKLFFLEIQKIKAGFDKHISFIILLIQYKSKLSSLSDYDIFYNFDFYKYLLLLLLFNFL